MRRGIVGVKIQIQKKHENMMNKPPISRKKLGYVLLGLWVAFALTLVWRWDSIRLSCHTFLHDRREAKIQAMHDKMELVTMRDSTVPSRESKSGVQSHVPGRCQGVVPVTGRPGLQLKPIAMGFGPLTDIAVAPGDASRIFVTEQHKGTIRIIRNGQILGQPFLDIGATISRGGERGLLGMAFHPDYRRNRKFYLYLTGRQGEVRVVEYRTTTHPDLAEPTSARTILVIPQPEANHNGGAIRFGPDGYLYLGVGDGGGGGDQHGVIGNAQDPKTWLGKILRVDVNTPSSQSSYAIPPNNPFVRHAGFLPEIVYSGLRNPWRFSFDRQTGDLWIGDVGQDRAEEINFAPRGRFGFNFGWRCKEGLLPFGGDKHCRSQSLRDPVLHLKHDRRQPQRFCSVMMGFRYRGCKMPDYHDTVFYGDYCLNHLRSFRWDGQRASREQKVPNSSIVLLTSWNEDHQGELLLTTGQGYVYGLVPR